MIRTYQEADFDRLCIIAARAWRDIFAGYRQQLGGDIYKIINPEGENSKTSQLRHFADETPENFLVAERGGRIVGFITLLFDHTRKIGIIGNNAVDPECGEKGVGQEMYQAAFDHFRAAGMKLAQVTTGMDQGHARARSAYERAGFCLHTEAVTYTKEL